VSDLGNIRHPKKKSFLAAFAACGSLVKASETSRVDRSNHYLWMKDPQYREAFQEAQDRAARMLEDIAVKRATADEGGSDTLLIFLLKCRNPAVFRDRASVEHSGEVEITKRLIGVNVDDI